MKKESQKIKKKNKKSKTTGLLFNILFFSLIGFLATYYVWNFIDIKSGYKYPTFGMRTTVIVSDSMGGVNDANTYITKDMKQIKKYDVVTTVGYKSFDDIKKYDIATYFDGSKNLICHRVVDKYVSEGKQYVVFRGDANAVSDVPVSYELVRGKVISITPKVGHAVAFIQSPYFFIAIFGIGFFVCLGLLISGKGKKKDKTPALETSGVSIENKPVENVSKEEKVYTPTVTFEEAANEIWPQLNYPKPLPKEEEKKAPTKEVASKDTAPKKEAPKAKPVKKAEPKVEKKEEKAKPEPVKEKPVKKEEAPKAPAKKAPSKEDKKDVGFRVYHVNKRKEDGKWTVKYAGGEKVIKLFDTQKEALEYANQMAKNQDGTVLVHASKGVNKGKIIKK